MHVLVGVDMIEFEPGRAKSLVLGAYLLRQLPPDIRQKEKAKAGAGHIGMEVSVDSDQSRNFLERRHRAPVDQHDVQADMQLRHQLRPDYSIRCRGRANHQARRRQNAVPMPLLDRFVNCGIEAEIVGANNQAFHKLSFSDCCDGSGLRPLCSVHRK